MTNDITVTLSGNSTPLLSGCGECAALRVRLAEAENSRDIARGVADAFRDTISRATGNPDAVHGLMILCQSHKSLAEAEARAVRAEEAVQKAAQFRAAMREVEASPAYQAVWVCHQIHAGQYNGPGWADAARVLDDALARAAVEGAR